MAGHALLRGCQQPWRHDDCPGQEPSPHATAGGPEFATGGLVCHCPCHGLQRRLAAALEAAPPPDEATLTAALPDWLDRIAPSIRPFVASIVVAQWPRPIPPEPEPPAGRTGPRPRGHCGECGRDVAVRRDGTAYWHVSFDLDDDLYECTGSRQPVSDDPRNPARWAVNTDRWAYLDRERERRQARQSGDIRGVDGGEPSIGH